MGLAPYIVGVQGQGPDGKSVRGLIKNEIKDYVRDFHFVTSRTDTVTLTAAGTAGATADTEFVIDSNGHFDWVWLQGNGNTGFTLEFEDVGRHRKLQNRPVFVSTVAGIGRRPFRLPEPYFFNVGQAERRLRCIMRNLGGTSVVARIKLHGRRFYHREAPPYVAMKMREQFPDDSERAYSYFLTPIETASDGSVTAVAANGTATFNFDTESDADTEIFKLMADSTGAFTFRLREVSTNRTVMNDAISSTNGWGTAQFPFVFADTYLLERGKRLVCDVTDISGNQNTIYLTMAGRRLEIER